MTYQELVALLKTYIRDDVSDMIPSFIHLAERRIERECNIRELLSVVDILYDDKAELPDDLLGIVSVRIGNKIFRYQSFDKYKGIEDSDSDYYTIQGNNLFLFSYHAPQTITIGYKRMIDKLSDTNNANDIITKYPDLYLHGVLVDSIPYSRSSGVSTLWSEYWKQSKNTVNEIGNWSNASEYIMKPGRDR